MLLGHGILNKTKIFLDLNSPNIEGNVRQVLIEPEITHIDNLQHPLLNIFILILKIIIFIAKT